MSTNMSNDNMMEKTNPSDTRAHDETVAGQEEIYLEETEETLQAVLISENPSTYVQQEIVCVDCCLVGERLDEQLEQAAEELITGDSDDPPLSEEAVTEVLKMTSSARRLDV